MKISSEILTASKIIGEKRTIEYYAKAGFDAWDFSMFSMCRYDKINACLLENEHPLAGNEYIKFARELKKVGLDNGIICNQAHAPFPSSCKEIRSYYKRAIECAKEAEAEIIVIHPDNRKGPEENAVMFNEILPFAKECKVKLATENMWCWDEEKGHSCFAACATPKSFNDHLDAVNDEYFVACLDIGHSEMKGSDTTAEEMILALGKRLQALHIHDNNKLKDCHEIPFSMDIDFEKIIKALKKIDYKGYFTLEAYNYLRSYNEDNVFEGILELRKSATRLAKMFENF